MVSGHSGNLTFKTVALLKCNWLSHERKRANEHFKEETESAAVTGVPEEKQAAGVTAVRVTSEAGEGVSGSTLRLLRVPGQPMDPRLF